MNTSLVPSGESAALRSPASIRPLPVTDAPAASVTITVTSAPRVHGPIDSIWLDKAIDPKAFEALR